MEHKIKQPSKYTGRNIGRMREMLGIKQDVVAGKLGLSQQKISKIEQSETVDDDTLEKVAEALGVSSEAIKNFNEEAIFNIVANTITNNDQSAVVNYYPSFNPIDKWLEAIDKIEKLYKELLKSEKEKVASLQKILDEMK